jgi:Transglutaminase-like superfamily
MAAVSVDPRLPTTTATARPSAPGRDELADALALLALTMIGIVGFRPAYGGHGYLAAGAAGIVIGLLLSYAGQRARLPLLAVVSASVLAFLLLGGVVSRTGTVSLPTLQTIMSAAISGWQQLLTTARPVGQTSGLLVLPYLLGLFSGVAGHALARRTRAVLLPAAAPTVVVALSILFGAPHPVAAVLQGAGFAAVALAWAAVRQDRGAGRQATIGRQRPWQRIGAGAVVLAVAGAGAVFIGPHLPGASAHKRVVLTVVPPFDVNQYPSPLAAFRDYTKVAPTAVSVYNKQLLSTANLPKGALVRIAAMDTYDGLTWGVANTVPVSTGPANAGPASTFGGFQRVGALLPGAPAGRADTATITVQPSYQQPWLPDLGATTGFSGFTAGSAAGCPSSSVTGSSVAASLRYYVAAGTGIILGGVPCALTYTVSYVPMAAPSLTALATYSPGGPVGESIVIPSAVKGFADAHAQSAGSPMAQVAALARYLQKNGRLSDGGNGLAEDTAGHSEGRLTTFLDSSTKQIVGDGEQYAATMALLANDVGVPARVSLDAAVEQNGTIKGSDVRADVELYTAERGWVTLPAKDFTGTKAPTLEQQSITPPQQPVKVVPPRHNQAAPVAATNESNAVARSSARPSSSSGGFAIPAIVITIATDAGIPVVVVAGLAGLLIAAKAVRRRHRRSSGPPATRVAGAWRELTDLSRDLGVAAMAGAPTRREFAAYAEGHGLLSARSVADAADAATFGPADPDGAAARHVWEMVSVARRGATATLPLWRRAWVAANPASLLAAHPAIGAAAARARRTARASVPIPRGAQA